MRLRNVLLRTHLNWVRKPVLYVMVLERLVDVVCFPWIILSDRKTVMELLQLSFFMKYQIT